PGRAAAASCRRTPPNSASTGPIARPRPMPAPCGRPAARRRRPMPYNSLRDFIDRLERDRLLVRVSAPVSPVLEMTEIQTRLLAQGAPAGLFENVIHASGRPH